MAANMDVSGCTEVSLDKKNYGVPDLMAEGPTGVKSSIVSSHPLEKSEKNFWKNQQEQEFANLRKIQGLHAPLRLMMERSIVSQCESPSILPSSNALADALSGRDTTIGFEDILNGVASSHASYNDLAYCLASCLSPEFPAQFGALGALFMLFLAAARGPALKSPVVERQIGV